MTVKVNTCEGMPVGVAITSSNQNTDATSGDVLTVSKGGAATMAATSTVGEVIYNSRSIKHVTASGENAYAYWTFTDGTVMAGRAAFRGFTPGSNTYMMRINVVGGAEACGVRRVAADGKLILRTPSATTLYTTPSAAPDPCVIDLACDQGTSTSTGKLSFCVYDVDGNYAAGMTGPVEYTGQNTAYGTLLRTVAFGKQDSGAFALTYYTDGFKAQDAYALLGPVTAEASADSRPIELLAASTWTAQGAADIVTALADDDDATYAESAANPGGNTLRVTMAPYATGLASINYGYASDASTPARSITVALYMGSTVIASRTVSTTSTTKQAGELALTAAELAAWTDRSAPEIRVTAN